MSLSARDENSRLGQAENALLSHVRAMDDDGHGNEDELPVGFDSTVAREHIVLRQKAQEAALQSSPPLESAPDL